MEWRPRQKPKEVRIAFIGTGVQQRSHIRTYANLPGVKFVAASDIVEEKLNEFCDDFNIEHRYVDYREMLKRDDIDAVDVTVHNNLHLPLVIEVLRAGKHCYCEKPMAGSFVDAVAMYEASEEYGKLLHIQLARIYDHVTVAAKEHIDSGKLGHIYHARSYGYRRRGRPYVDGYAEKEFDQAWIAQHGALYDMGVYHISQLLYLLGLPKLERVSGKVYQELDMDPVRKEISKFDVEELGVGFAHYENGLTLDILESWAIHGGPFPPSAIYGSKGGVSLGGDFSSIKADPMENAFTFYDEELGYPRVVKLDLQAEFGRRVQVDPNYNFYANSQAHWLAALRGQCELLPTKDIALETMRVSEGLFLSSTLNREIYAEEIPTLSKSTALRTQETPFGTLKYDF
ncbi:MAG: Gfo/Idh/MocA family oxidoreductase [Syntrophales bacterium]|jgi:predicted dehydrogenase|nr:Gfo/Idh/MocA family oxidoreductase [Syntrophales bacterium]